MIGYSPSSKAYCLYHSPSHKIIEAFHVDFIESRDDEDLPFKPGQVIVTLDADSSFTPDNDSLLLAEPAPLMESAPMPAPSNSWPQCECILTEHAKAMSAALSDDELNDILAHFSDLNDNNLELELAYILELPDHIPAPSDPQTISEDLYSPNASQWRESIEEELQGFKDLCVYHLIPPSQLPASRKLLKGKMVF
jgi:hypothetical protein